MRGKATLLTMAFLALALALAGCGGGKGGSAGSAGGQAKEAGSATASAGDAKKGQEVYKANCASCHGQDAKGMPGLGPNFASANGQKPVRERLSESDHLQIVRKGRVDKGMPAWEGTLTAQQILDVVAYERSLN